MNDARSPIDSTSNRFMDWLRRFVPSQHLAYQTENPIVTGYLTIFASVVVANTRTWVRPRGCLQGLASQAAHTP
jgi:hypothetical protein